MMSSVYLREKPNKMTIELQNEFFHNIKKLDDLILNVIPVLIYL